MEKRSATIPSLSSSSSSSSYTILKPPWLQIPTISYFLSTRPFYPSNFNINSTFWGDYYLNSASKTRALSLYTSFASPSSSSASISSSMVGGTMCSTDTQRLPSQSSSPPQPTSNSFKSKSKSHDMIDLLSCGFVSGVLQAVIFNPWDRALYLSIKVK